MSNLRKAGISLNRKLLADMAITDPNSFKELIHTGSSL
ncbi:MAG: 50S ribosomal protein L20 [Candidatus Thorarchaeota archaeon]